MKQGSISEWHIGNGPSSRAPHRTLAPPLGRTNHVEIDLHLEDLLHAPHERVPVLFVGVDERAERSTHDEG